MFKIKKLNNHGIVYHFLIALIMLIVGVGGTYVLVTTKADSGVSCTIASPLNTPMYNHLTYAPQYSISNSTTSSFAGGSASLSIYSGSYSVGSTVKPLYSSAISISKALSPSSTIYGNIGQYVPSSISTTTPMTAVFSGSLNSNASSSSTINFSCTKSFTVNGLVSSLSLSSTDWYLNKDAAITNDGVYKNVIKLYDVSSSIDTKAAAVNTFSIPDNGKTASVCLYARAIESSAVNYGHFQVTIDSAGGGSSPTQWSETFQPRFNEYYQQYCWSVPLATVEGLQVGGSNNLAISIYDPDVGYSFFIRAVTAKLL